MSDLIERTRAQVRAALRNHDMDRAWFLVRIVVGLRICAGEIDVRLKANPKIVS
jgi:hypothetical protein